MIFLVADTQLYKRLCPSVGPSVHWSVGPLVRRSVTHESKSGKTSILDAFMGMCVGGGHGVWIGVRPGDSAFFYTIQYTIQYFKVLGQYNTIPIQYNTFKNCIQYLTILCSSCYKIFIQFLINKLTM